jgi:large subunit ribosomal protein L17
MSNLATSLFEHGSIRTTYAKAKELRGVADHLITFAKRGDLHARRQVLRRIQNKVVVSKLFDEIGPTYADRNGGYTRVLKLGPRRGDSTELCLVELVGEELRANYAERSASRDQARAERPEPAAAEAPAAEAAPEPAAKAEETESEAAADEASATPAEDEEKKADS